MESPENTCRKTVALPLFQAVEQSHESIVITNTVPEIEYVNPAFMALTGYTREELIGKNPRILNSGQNPPETYQALWCALTRGESWRGELVNRRKNGALFSESAIISPIRQADGTVSHYLAIKQDISEQKRLLQELEQHRNELSLLVNERTAALNSANQEIKALNESLERRVA